MTRAASRRSASNVPPEATSFINRRAEVMTARRLLRSARLVTLTGPGGVGKTRVALRVAREMERSFRDGVGVVDLAPLQDRSLLADTVVQVLGISDQSTRSRVDVLCQYLRTRRLLLVLDNCERVAAECGELVSTLLRAVPGLRVLVTSRHCLEVSGEHIVTISPLDAPVLEWTAPLRVDPEHHAVALFAERAKAVLPGFAVTPHNDTVVGQVCRQLDGLPLAIELAAARLRSLSLTELARRLDDHSRLRLSGPRPPMARHSTLYATLSWSFELCGEAERRMWARISVFSGGFDLAAAENVCAGDDIDADDVLDLVTGLVDKSLLIRQEHEGQARYRLLDTVRQFGLERLRDIGEEDILRRRHRDWYLRLAEHGDAEWFGPHQVEWFTRLRLDHANLRVALNYCLTTPGERLAGLRMATTLWFYWIACGFVAEGCHWIERALELNAEPTPERAKALWVDGDMAAFQGDNRAALRVLEESRDLAQRLGDEPDLAYATQMLGLAALGRGDMLQADALLRDALMRHQALGQFDANVAVCPVMLAYAAVGRGDFDRAVRLSNECQVMSQQHGDIWARSWALWALSLVEWYRGRSHEAAAYARECLRIKHIFHDVLGMAFALDMLGWTAAVAGQSERAAVLLGAAQETWLTMGQPQADAAALIESRDRSEAAARSALGDGAFDEAFKRGTNLDVNQAVDYALASDPTHPPETDSRPVIA